MSRRSHTVALAMALVLTLSNISACLPVSGQPALQSPAEIQVDWNHQIGAGPTYYGVEYSWIDQDSALFLERYRLLNPNLLRVQVTQEYFEPVNDNDDPSVSEIDFDVTFTLDAALEKQVTYRQMFSTLAAEFPDMHFHINVWLAARWNASDPAGYLGLGGAFPPLDYAEHREFIRALARWLVDECGIEPARLSFSFINEPNLSPFFVGTLSDLGRMANETRSALDEVSPDIEMMGLDEVHGLQWTDDFYAAHAGSCCDAWTFHVYERGVASLWDALRTRVEHLNRYGPVWVTEFADTNQGSPDAQMDFSTREAALGFAEVVGRLWASGVDGVVHFRLSDSYVDQLGGWAGHGLFADWRGTKSDGVPYAIYPAFWVFAGLFGELGDGAIVHTTAPSELVVVAARHDDASPRLALSVTNPTWVAYSTTIQIAAFPASGARVSVRDNLTGDMIHSWRVAGSPPVFAVSVPQRSSLMIVVSPSSPPSLYLPFILKTDMEPDVKASGSAFVCCQRRRIASASLCPVLANNVPGLQLYAGRGQTAQWELVW